MFRIETFVVAFAFATLVLAVVTEAGHDGRLDSDGCHFSGAQGYHCH
jgi:hypothetical protein